MATEPTPLPFALPDITEQEIDAVVEVLRSRWLTTGAQAREFESRFAERVGAPHAVALNSCTAALHLALEALGVSRATSSTCRRTPSRPAARWSATSAPRRCWSTSTR